MNNILSSRGILGYESKNEENILHFKQIKNNINNFIGEKQFSKGNWFSLKDLLIHNDQIYVSFTEEIKEDCWNTSLLNAKFNYENIIFKKIFSPKECVNASNNIDHEFNVHMVTASAYLAQDYSDCDEYLVEAVPMPEGLVAWVSEFVSFHYEEKPFVKRQRDKIDFNKTQDGIGDLRIKQTSDVYRNPSSLKKRVEH